jgi:hypothetical protein
VLNNPSTARDADFYKQLQSLGQNGEKALQQEVFQMHWAQDPDAALHKLQGDASLRNSLLEALRDPKGDPAIAIDEALSEIPADKFQDQNVRDYFRGVLLQRTAELVSEGKRAAEDPGIGLLSKKLGLTPEKTRDLEKDVSTYLRENPKLQRALDKPATEYTPEERQNLEVLAGKIGEATKAQENAEKALGIAEQAQRDRERAFKDQHGRTRAAFDAAHLKLREAEATLNGIQELADAL